MATPQTLPVKTWLVFIMVAFFAGGFLGGMVLRPSTANAPDGYQASQLRAGGYVYINPLLECEGSEALSQNLQPSRADIDLLIDKLKKQGAIDYAAVYFRDLNNGPWFGINEKEPFRPASLLKVPLMIGMLKMAEQDPDLFNKTITDVTPYLKQEQYFKPAHELELGKTYTVGEAIQSMIIYSDNRAANALAQVLGQKKESQVYQDMGIAPPSYDSANVISVKNYGSFFRILFNASYLSKEFSERALELLTMVDFKDGLTAGVPKGIRVAHKFGESSITPNAPTGNQLHDCGIVYYPGHPYLLCVMTRGSNFDRLAESIAEISKEVYGQVSKQF